MQKRYARGKTSRLLQSGEQMNEKKRGKTWNLHFILQIDRSTNTIK